MAPPECEGEGKEVAIMVVDAAKDMASSPTYAGTEEGGQAARAQETFVLSLRGDRLLHSCSRVVRNARLVRRFLGYLKTWVCSIV